MPFRPADGTASIVGRTRPTSHSNPAPPPCVRPVNPRFPPRAPGR